MTIQHGALDGRTCWIISDGKAGNDVQTHGIANALGLAITVKRVTPRGLHKLLSPWIGVPSGERFGQPGSTFAPPWPDIAMSIGRLTTPYIRELKRRAGAATFTVILQNPKVPLRTADLFWVPEHDKLRGANVITSLTAPHGFSEQRLATLRQNLPAPYAALRQPRVAVMLGGSNGDYSYSPATLERLERAIKALGRAGASLLITPSRRSEKGYRRVRRTRQPRLSTYFLGYDGREPLSALPRRRRRVPGPGRQHQHDRGALCDGKAGLCLSPRWRLAQICTLSSGFDPLWGHAPISGSVSRAGAVDLRPAELRRRHCPRHSRALLAGSGWPKSNHESSEPRA